MDFRERAFAILETFRVVHDLERALQSEMHSLQKLVRDQIDAVHLNRNVFSESQEHLVDACALLRSSVDDFSKHFSDDTPVILFDLMHYAGEMISLQNETIVSLREKNRASLIRCEEAEQSIDCMKGVLRDFAKKSEADLPKCSICLGALEAPWVTAIPCGHRIFCQMCYEDGQKLKWCPLCRSNIASFVLVF
jgi:hypothetical protein